MSLPVTDLHLVRTDSLLLSPKSKWQQFFSAHKKWVPNQFSCFDTHLNVLRYPMDLTSFSLDFFLYEVFLFHSAGFFRNLIFLFVLISIIVFLFLILSRHIFKDFK